MNSLDQNDFESTEKSGVFKREPEPEITVLRSWVVRSPDSDKVERDDQGNAILSPDDVLACTLDDALTRAWPTDAMACQYSPVSINGVRLRLTADAFIPEKAGAVRMVARFGDIDDPVAHKQKPKGPARDDWRAEVLPRIIASGLAYYSTRGGYRVVQRIDADWTIASPEDAAEWADQYLGWCEYLRQTYDLEVDPKCADWPHLFRLPNVNREDAGPVRASIVGTVTAFDPEEYIKPASAPSASAGTVGPAEPIPSDIPEPSARVLALADAIRDVFLEGNRFGDKSLLCFFGWLLGKGWSKGDLAALLHVLAEPDAKKRAECTRVLKNAKKRTGPGAAKEWLGDSYDAVDRIVNPAGKVTPKQSEAFDRRHEPKPGTECPLYVVNDGRVWIYNELAASYRAAVKLRDLVPALRAANLYDVVAQKADGGYLRAEAIYERGELVTDFAKDFAEPRTLCRREGERLLLIEGHECPVYEAEFDLDVEAWLKCLFGDDLDKAKDWIAACAQEYISKPAACFVHVGPDSIGKTLIHLVLARMWGASEPVPLGAALAQFNGSTRRCPNVLDDEARDLARRDVTTRDMRTLIAATVRDVELKGKERSELRGCLRYAITANAIEQVPFRDLDSANTVAALDVRFAWHTTPNERKAEAEALLAKLRKDPSSDRADLDRIARHFAWIQATHEIADARFLGSHRSTGAVLAGHVASYAKEFETLEHELGREGAGSVAHHPDGRLLVSTALLAQAVTKRIDYSAADLGRVQRALAPLRIGTDRVKYTPLGFNKGSFWVINREKLLNLLNADSEKAEEPRGTVQEPRKNR